MEARDPEPPFIGLGEPWVPRDKADVKSKFGADGDPGSENSGPCRKLAKSRLGIWFWNANNRPKGAEAPPSHKRT